MLRATDALGVRTHVSVPIHLPDGRCYGTFCCFGLGVSRSVDERDLETIRMLARLVADYLGELDAEEGDLRRRAARIATILDDPAGLRMVYQPLVELTTGRLIGVEALARFPTVAEGPQWAFSEAWAVGFGVELEIKA
ncbi:MAG: diguanylate phosphodiesterase, partial [Actinobacteria bacterium]|nr:diguanylate phosphodiesterase [Actinomycetota bacterium]